MNYKAATTQRGILLLAAFILLTVSIGSGGTAWVKWLSLIMFVISLLIAFIKYTLTINEKTIVYSVHLFGISIYKSKPLLQTLKKSFLNEQIGRRN